MMYSVYQTFTDLMEPWRWMSKIAVPFLDGSCPSASANDPAARLSAACKLLGALRLTHARPPFGIDRITIARQDVAVTEKPVLRTPFGTLTHFAKDAPPGQPKVLLVAPMSGHFATLLRGTVRTLLADHDVFVTDWHNARDIPLAEGRFGLDDYTLHLVRFLEALGPDAHLVAICQPCVSALAAVALMAAENHVAQPRTMTLMAGPIDTRINPTEVNRLATSKSYDWFERNLISRVPLRHPGAMRRVYPGFLQILAFMSMNQDRHHRAFADLYQALLDGDAERARTIAVFYEEYFAACDLPAEFYLETVRRVFQQADLARGALTVGDRKVEPAVIRRTALLTVEGEKDDICSVGQTLAAQDLCTAIRPYMKEHHVQTGVGHYGVFNGRKWELQIYPRLREFIHQHSGS